MPRTNPWRGIFVENLTYKVVALLISVLIWLLVLGRGHQTEDINLKIQYARLAAHLTVENASNDMVKLRVKGPPKLIRKFILENDSYVIEQELSQAGIRRLRLGASSLLLPSGLRLLSITPNELRLVLSEKTKQE